MSAWLCFVVLGTPLWAGVIQGVVLEQASNLPLARTRVRVERIEGMQRVAAATVVAASMGQFVVHGLRSGQYVVTAARTGYAPALYRATPGDSRTAVLNLKDDAEIFAEVRMQRMGAITGRIVDENRIGIPGVTVIAYAARLPLRSAAQAKSDDRGVYRISGLHAGRYYVRTAPTQLDDGPGLLPTFFPHGTALSDARPVRVDYDRETSDVEFRPVEGRLFQLTVRPQCLTGSVNLVLSTDTGRREGKTACDVPYVFTELAPADYELLATLGDGAKVTAAWQQASWDRDASITVQPVRLPQIDLETRPTGVAATVVARRRDLAGPHEVVAVPVGRTNLLPGYWGFAARPDESFYVTEIGTGNERWPGMRPTFLPDGEWFEFRFDKGMQDVVRVEMAEGAATLSGTVRSKGDAVAGAPVHAFPLRAETRRAMGGPRTVSTDKDGRYRLTGLAPGDYLVSASFDIPETGEESMREAKAGEVTLADHEAATRELTLWEPE